MRILMLAQFYRPVIGGEETHVRSLSIALAARGHEVSVATLQQSDLPEVETDQGVRIHRIHSTMQRATGVLFTTDRQHAPPFPDPEIMLALRRLIRQERPDIVHAHNWILHSFTPMKVWSKAKFVISLHDYSLICAQKLLLYRGDKACSGPAFAKCLGCAGQHYGTVKGTFTTLSNWAMNPTERAAADQFITVSEAVAELNRLSKSRLPYHVIPNFVPDDVGVLDDPASEFDPRLDQLPKVPYLLFVGDLRHLKGVDVLVKAYGKLTDHPNMPPLVLIGRECEDTPTELPPNVTMIKGWPHDLVMMAWRRALIGIVPTVAPEAFGIVIIEAMANGIPVIASRIGGIPEIVVDGETGILCPPGDADALSAAIERLVADPALIERMGQAGKRRMSLFLASTVIPQFEAVYQELAPSQARTAPTSTTKASAITE